MIQNRNMLLIAAVLTLGLASLAAAQMMGGSHGQMSTSQNDTLSHSATMGMREINKMNQADSTIINMSQYSRMMSDEFDKLQSHFDKMMQIQDMKTLKAEMQKHQELMNQMHESMGKQHSMIQNMMSMMHSGRMNRMMGMNTDKTETGGHPHNH